MQAEQDKERQAAVLIQNYYRRYKQVANYLKGKMKLMIRIWKYTNASIFNRVMLDI